ncbi:MAG: GDP-mannose 4,6-dehydratase [Pirellulales bacterium]|nr:GDP-mannose 4,6-dehydratase [Pirellulales bacterium]
MALPFLVTGAAGFIASNVCKILLDQGETVVGIDNLSDAYDPQLKEWRLAQLRQHPHFHYFPTDISDFFAVKTLFEQYAAAPSAASGVPFAAVLNLAARAGVRPSVRDPWIYFKVNTDGTLNLLELCRKFGVKKFVLSSTSSLYGGKNPIPFAEDADTNCPLSPYAASKKAAEAIAYTYHHLHKLDITVLRYFTVYGPAGRPDMSVFRFIRWIARGEAITVFGDGSQSRDFTFVEDIARGTVAAARPLGYQVINLGGDEPAKLLDVIYELAKLLDKTPQLVFKPAHPADVPATWANIGQAEKLLDWRPTVPLAEGLRRTVEWYRQNQELADRLDLGEI